YIRIPNPDILCMPVSGRSCLAPCYPAMAAFCVFAGDVDAGARTRDRKAAARTSLAHRRTTRFYSGRQKSLYSERKAQVFDGYVRWLKSGTDEKIEELGADIESMS